MTMPEPAATRATADAATEASQLISSFRYAAHSGLMRAFVRRHLPFVAAWPVVALLVASVMWVLTLTVLERGRETVRRETMTQAASLSRAYAQQLKRTVENLDQITLSLKYDWETPGAELDLERQRNKGLYPASSQLYASVIDRNGKLLTSTFPFDQAYDFSDEPHYLGHKQSDTDDLLITGPLMSVRLQRPVINFSRRLVDERGELDGIAIVVVEPPYLAAFHDEALLGKNDFVSVRHVNGPVLATKVGQRPGVHSVFYRNDPIFSQRSGVIVEPAKKFKDERMRFVSWQKLDSYPLVALAAISADDAFAAHNATARNYLAFATGASILLFLLATVGAVFSARLAWRRLQEEDVKQTYRLAVDAAREGFYMLRPLYDREGAVVDFQVEDSNERGATMIGLTKSVLIGRKFSELYPEYGQTHIDSLRRAFELGFHEDELRVSPDSRLQVNWVHRRVVRSGGGLALTVRDISDLKAHEQQLSNMANADALTTLPNRNWLTNYLPLAIEHARVDGTGLAVLFIDLDDFKNINDTLGHVAGDELLKAAAARLRRLVRASDHVVRLGGDKFTVILERVARVEDLAGVARQIVDSLSEPFTLGRSAGHRVHASVGISVFPQDGADGETLLKHADVAMYAAKAAGKGRLHFYQSHLSDRLVLRINREQALRQAIERDEFVLHYQPRVDTITGKLLSVEALVRWMHPELGVVPPLEFIDLAEDTGLIVTLGRMVIEKACAQIAQWKAHGLPVVPVSINVSAVQFNQGNVTDILASCMREYGVEAAQIGVELTESCMAGQDEAVAVELDGLRALGVKLLVDDFGTGYSSLSQLQRLNVDVLKVDRAFTLSLCDGEEGKALFKAIVSMADALDICIVAEGVETPEQLGVLQSLACDEVQGHLVSRPVPASDVPALMKKRFLFPPAVRRTDLATV